MTTPPPPPPAAPPPAGPPTQPGYPVPPAYPGYPAQPGYQAHPGYQVPPGYQIPPGYQAPPGYPAPPPGYRVPPPPPVSPGGQRLAEFTDRLVAYIIDYAILTAIISVVALPVYLFAFFQIFGDLPTTVIVDDQVISAEPTPDEVFGALGALFGVLAVIFLFAALVIYVYEVELMFRSGQTLGKRIMKIQIVPIDPSLALTRGMATRRVLVQYGVGAFVPFFTYIDGLWQLWDKPYRQCLHDKWATTVVIKLNP